MAQEGPGRPRRTQEDPGGFMREGPGGSKKAQEGSGSRRRAQERPGRAQEDSRGPSTGELRKVPIRSQGTPFFYTIEYTE